MFWISRNGHATAAFCVAVLIAAAPASAAVIHQPIPDSYPQIEVERLQLTYLRKERLPVMLMGALTFVNPDPPSVNAGRLEFTVKQKGLVMLMASWDDDEPAGDWTPQAITRNQLGQTWIDLGPASWDANQVLFIRECRAGETYSLRTRRDVPPVPILTSHIQLTKMRQGASTLREAMQLALRPQPQTQEEFVEYLAYGVPEGAAVIAADNTQLFPLEGENIPPYLKGAKIYRPVPSERPGAPVSSETVSFGVVRAGPLYLMASWEEEGEELEEVLSYRQVLMEWAPLGRCPWDPEYQLFFRNSEVGYGSEVHTRDGYPALPIVAPSADPLAEIAGSAAVLEVTALKPYALQEDSVPSYLRGAVIYRPHELDRGFGTGYSLLRFHVKQDGPVYLLASWKDDRKVTPKLNLAITSYEDLQKEWLPLGRCPWDQDQWMFVRECRAGEHFRIKTRHTAPPLPIVAPRVDVLSEEYADSVPVRLRERAIARQICQLVAARHYAALDQLAQDYRRSNARLSTMHSALSLIYSATRAVSTKDNQHYIDRIAELEKWVADSPDSLTAHVALAGMLTDYGYFIRGKGFADTVSQRQFEGFHEQLTRAEQVLQGLDESVPRDVSYYARRISIGIGLGASREEVLGWAQEAARLDPWNEAATGAAMTYFLPRWHGEPGDLVKLAEALVETTRDEYGEALYARVVMEVRDWSPVRSFTVDDFSWERTRQGLAELRKRFPQSRRLLNVQCQLAGLAFDRELAAACFAEIGDDPDLDVWKAIEEFEMRRQAFSPELFEGEQNRVWMVHANGAKDARFSPDGTKLLTSGYDTLIKIWDVATGRELRRLKMMATTNCVDFLDDSKIVIGSHYGEIIIWDWEDDVLHPVVRLPKRIFELDASPDGRYLFLADSVGKTVVVDLDLQQEVHGEEKLHGIANWGVFSADSQFLATTGSRGGIIIHNLEVSRPESQLEQSSTKNSAIAFSPDGTHIATGEERGDVNLWQIDGWQQVVDAESRKTFGDSAWVRGLAFSPDGRHLAIARGGGEYLETGGLWILTLDGTSKPRRIPGHATSVLAVDFSPDGQTLLSVGGDWTLRLYDVTQLLSD